MHNDYADRKNGRKPITYLHPDMAEVLGDTHGPDDLPGVDDAGGPEVRRLLPRRGRQPAQGGGQEGPRDHGHGAGEVRRRLRARPATAADIGTTLFDIIEPFADYAFNKCHSYGYGLVSYQTAWLKANHPVEYLAALLTSVKDDKDKTAVYLAECRSHGHRGPGPRHQRVGLGLHRPPGRRRNGPGGHPLRAVRHPQRRRGPGRADRGRAGRGRARSPTSTTSATGSTRSCSTSGRSSR